MTNLASIVAVALASHGLTGAAAATVQAKEVPGITGQQAEITIGYDKGGKRKITAQVLVGSVDDAAAYLGDRERIGALIALGVRAMPASARPEIPGWVANSDAARRHDAMRARASAVAETAANDASDLPWAA